MSMTLSKELKFLLVIVFQLAVVFAIIIFKLSVLTGGTEILLHIQPVDPRDLLRGDYVTFRYDISTIPSYYFRDVSVRPGDMVYVSLYRSGKYWIVQDAALEKPSSGIFIKGVVQDSGFSSQVPPVPGLTVPERNDFIENREVRVKYGAEEYFIPEGAGRNFSFFNHDVGAQLAVDDNGNAVLKKLFVDGKQWP